MKKRLLSLFTVLVLALASVCAAFAETPAASFGTPGSIVSFGRYEQDGDEANGPEPIEWLVLDVKDERSLLVSRYALDCVPYHTKDEKITWAQCSLRKWLNGEFLQTAFTEAEQEAIPEAKVDNSQKQSLRRWNNWKKTKGGRDTKDRVFLLSYLEAKQYLSVVWDGDNNPKGALPMTEYVSRKTADSRYRCREEDDPGYGHIRWWLRSPGYLQDLVATVQETGVLIAVGSTSEEIAVRPAIRVDLDRINP